MDQPGKQGFSTSPSIILKETIEWGGGGETGREKTNSTVGKKKKKTFIAVIFITEKNCKLLRCPIGECPARILTQ